MSSNRILLHHTLLILAVALAIALASGLLKG